MTESVTDVRCVLREERKEARARARKINSRRRKKRAKCVCVLETHTAERAIGTNRANGKQTKAKCDAMR
jgi:hypothetical protein